MVLPQRTVRYLLRNFDSLEQPEGNEVSWLYHNTQRLAEDSLADATLIVVAKSIIKGMGLSTAALPAWLYANLHIDLIAKMPLTSLSSLQTRRTLKPKSTPNSSNMTNLSSPSKDPATRQSPRYQNTSESSSVSLQPSETSKIGC